MPYRVVVLTTFDNPFDPIDDFDNWWRYDRDHQYNTNELIARLIQLSPQFSPFEEMKAQENAIDTIIKNDFQNIYKKVVREVDN